jgi:glycine hydroxymethyltransferase
VTDLLDRDLVTDLLDRDLGTLDAEVHAAITAELERQQSTLEMIASENSRHPP